MKLVTENNKLTRNMVDEGLLMANDDLPGEISFIFKTEKTTR
ncbi:MAG: hypothetical protein V4676_10100 [Bacteroidota bacterium]